jgi:dipeptidyl aminopeptidase/acylaminoacyl peptidase
VSIWDLRTPSPPEELAHGEWIERIALSPGGAMLLVAGGTTARVHDLDSGSEALLETYTGNSTDAAFSPDGRRIVITSGDQTARVWDTRTGRQVASLDHRGWVTSAVFSPRGSRVATGSADQSARVWDLDDNRIAELRGHSDAVIGVAFHPRTRVSDSAVTEFVVTATADGSVRLWAVDQTDAAVVMEWRGSAGPIAAAFSPEGRRVATGDQDGVVRIHECESCQSTHELVALARSRLQGPVNHEGEEF